MATITIAPSAYVRSLRAALKSYQACFDEIPETYEYASEHRATIQKWIDDVQDKLRVMAAFTVDHVTVDIEGIFIPEGE